MAQHCHPKITMFGRSPKRKGAKTMARTLSYRLGIPLKELSGRSAGGERKNKEEYILYRSFFPENASHFKNPQAFADAVDLAEKRIDAQFAIEIMLPIPRVLNEQQRKDVTTKLCHILMGMGEYGFAALHQINKDNPHIHVIVPDRKIDKNNGRLSEKKEKYFSNKKKRITSLRFACQDAINKVFEANNFHERVDYRSYEEQGKFILPTKHVTPYYDSEYGRRIKRHNEKVKAFNAEYIERVDKTIEEVREADSREKEQQTKLLEVRQPQSVENLATREIMHKMTENKRVQTTAAENEPKVASNTSPTERIKAKPGYQLLMDRRKKRLARNISLNRAPEVSHPLISREI